MSDKLLSLVTFPCLAMVWVEVSVTKGCIQLRFTTRTVLWGFPVGHLPVLSWGQAEQTNPSVSEQACQEHPHCQKELLVLITNQALPNLCARLFPHIWLHQPSLWATWLRIVVLKSLQCGHIADYWLTTFLVQPSLQWPLLPPVIARSFSA